MRSKPWKQDGGVLMTLALIGIFLSAVHYKTYLPKTAGEAITVFAFVLMWLVGYVMGTIGRSLDG